MKQNKKTGFDWAKRLGITVVKATGWETDEQFNLTKISKTEFLNRASASELKVDGDVSRRAAAKLFKTI